MKPIVVALATEVLESPPARGAWIETINDHHCHRLTRSPPARGAWIETPFAKLADAAQYVAPRAGGVD